MDSDLAINPSRKVFARIWQIGETITYTITYDGLPRKVYIPSGNMFLPGTVATTVIKTGSHDVPPDDPDFDDWESVANEIQITVTLTSPFGASSSNTGPTRIEWCVNVDANTVMLSDTARAELSTSTSGTKLSTTAVTLTEDLILYEP